jgi:X-X-X-Leu-X-X-Gly heptad repeat protein
MNKKTPAKATFFAICLLLVVALSASSQPAIIAAAGSATDITATLTSTAQDNETPEVKKNETIYGLLNNDGSIKSVEIVNHVFLSGQAGTNEKKTISWVDYGAYDKLINLLDERDADAKPAATETIKAAAAQTGQSVDKYDGMRQLSWNNLDTSNWQDLYYQGSGSYELPWLIDISWQLDGQQIETAADLAGISGKIELEISIKRNPQAAEVYNNSFLLQLSVPLPLDRTRNIEAENASSMITGRIRTLAWNVLPGQELDISISFEAEDFRMDPIQLTALESTAGIDGLDQLTDGISQIRQGQTELAAGIDQYAAGGQQVLIGYAQLASQLNQLRLPAEQITQLQQLLTMPDQLPDGTSMTAQKEMAQSLLTLDGAIAAIEQGITQLNTGLGDYVDGAGKLSDEYGQLHAGIAALAPATGGFIGGVDQLSTGFSQREQGLKTLNSGLGTLAQESASLPAAADALADGGQELADGLSEIEQAVQTLLDVTPVERFSYAAPGLIQAESVQFLVRTQGIN